MLKANAQTAVRTRRGASRAGSGETRVRILEATLGALGEHGYAATTARVIAARGGFPVGLIFYHYPTLDDLLLAVLDHTSAARLPRWKEALADVDDAGTLLERMQALYAEDVSSAHALAVRELIAGGGFSERLAPELGQRMEPWFALAESVAARVLRGSALLEELTPRDLAVTAVALYLGLETVARLSGQPAPAAALFAAGAQYAPLLGGLRSRSEHGARPTRLDIE